MIENRHASPGVLFRDFAIFHIKLLLDGLKGVALFQAGIVAFCLDMIFMLFAGSRRSRFFYTVLNWGERADLWLNLYGASKRAADNPDGLFGESRAGDDTLLGEIEDLVRKEKATRADSTLRARAGLRGA